MDYKNTITKFLSQTASKRETDELLSHIDDNPDAINELLPETEWQEYQRAKYVSTNDNNYGKIKAATITHYNKLLSIKYAAMSVAASVILILGLQLFNKKQEITSSSNIAAQALPQQITRVFNNKKIVQKILLPDATIVMLTAGSEVVYNTDYNKQKRDIYLNGKATFEVAKNKEKPFTVFCKGIATTALGTKFLVDGTAINPVVKLYEGKVVVKQIQNNKNATYLLPGNAITYNTIHQEFEKTIPDELVKSHTQPVIAAGKNIVNVQQPVITVAAAKQGYTRFKNMPLTSVLNNLADKYQVEINYPTAIANVTNVYMEVDTAQSIDVILKNIAALQNLELSKKADNKYILSK